jgi:SP family arabinose:H+ symporter-like MFS transporter
MSQNRQRLFLINFIAAMGGFLFGFDTAVISGALPFVVGDFHFDALMEGWFVSSALLGCIVGVALSGKLSDVYGRKKIMLLSAILFFLSAIGCMLAPGAGLLIGFRLVGGLGIGVASMICPLYISESSPSGSRGRMVALYQLAITIGIVGAYFSNAGLLHFSAGYKAHLSAVPDGLAAQHDWLTFFIVEHPWRGMIGLGLVPAFIFLAGLFFVPESPRWQQLQLRISEEDREERSIRRLFSPVYRIALIIGLILPFLSQVSGINAVIYYGPSILDKAGFSLGDALGGQVIIGFVNVIFTVAAIFTVDKWGRKPLLFIGIAGSVAALLVIGFLFRADSVQGPWVLTFILLFIACFAFSFGPVCWIVVSEIFPGGIRGQAMSLATLSLWVANFLVGQLTPVMLRSPHWGPSATFWTFAILCAPGLWITWKLIPETKGKTLEEIEAYWVAKRR